MPTKVKNDKTTTAAVALIALLAAAGGGYALAPDGTTIPGIPEDCVIRIAGEEISCVAAIEEVKAQAEANANTEMMLDLNKQGIICLDNDGEFIKQNRQCVIDGETYDWNGDTYQLLKTL